MAVNEMTFPARWKVPPSMVFEPPDSPTRLSTPPFPKLTPAAWARSDVQAPALQSIGPTSTALGVGPVTVMLHHAQGVVAVGVLDRVLDFVGALLVGV